MAIAHVDEGLGLSPDTKCPTIVITNDSGTDKSDNEEEECPDDKSSLASSFRALMALIALSFHAIAEGVAIGIQVST